MRIIVIHLSWFISNNFYCLSFWSFHHHTRIYIFHFHTTLNGFLFAMWTSGISNCPRPRTHFHFWDNHFLLQNNKPPPWWFCMFVNHQIHLGHRLGNITVVLLFFFFLENAFGCGYTRSATATIHWSYTLRERKKLCAEKFQRWLDKIFISDQKVYAFVLVVLFVDVARSIKRDWNKAYSYSQYKNCWIPFDTTKFKLVHLTSQHMWK